MEQRSAYSSSSEASVLQTNKVLRNTYTLLAMTMAFSAVCAVAAMAIGVGHLGSMAMFFGGFISMFIVNKKADSASGIYWAFVFTGLLGGSLGYMLSAYASLPNGTGIIAQALGGTALVFFALSGYALTTKKDFSFMGGFLIVGLVVAVVAMVANIFLAIPALSLAISSAVIFIMSGFILYDTSRIIHGGETNYIRATVGMYLNIYNIFVHLLSILGILGGDD